MEAPHAPGIRTPWYPHMPQASEEHHVPTHPGLGAFGPSART